MSFASIGASVQESTVARVKRQRNPGPLVNVDAGDPGCAFRSTRATSLTVAALLVVSLPAQADERDQLNACQALVERTAQSQKREPDTPEIARCRQIIKEWTLRDSRMSVDEQGRPLR